jgi:hypothetical protein
VRSSKIGKTHASKQSPPVSAAATTARTLEFVSASVRLRQVALVAADCDATSRDLMRTFGWREPFHDSGVGAFGLTNSVFAVGDTFVEVVAPREVGTTAGRYRERRGGDSGYMAIFQLSDLAAARDRLVQLGVRVVWRADLDDIAGTHLHPKDVPGALVSLDWAEPADSWRWAGPAWVGGAPPHSPGGLTGITVEVPDPQGTGQRWAAVLGLTAASSPGVTTVDLPESGQTLRFVPCDQGKTGAIVSVEIAGLATLEPKTICGVRFVRKEPT